MTTAIQLYRPGRAKLTLAQAAWDQFLEDALSAIDEPNPDLRHDLALDKTIRALGRRPRGPLTPEEREELTVRHEVEQIITESSRIHNYGTRPKSALPTEPNEDDENEDDQE